MLDGHREILSPLGFHKGLVAGLKFLDLLIGVVEGLGDADT